MHIDHCPKCGRPGYLVRKFRLMHGKRYGPYPTVQHYDSKSAQGTTKVKLCFISLKKLYPSEEARISRLLAQEKAREKEALLKRLEKGKGRHHL